MPKFLNIEKPAPLAVLATLDNRMALESSVVSNFADTVSNIIPSMMRSAKDFLDGFDFGAMPKPGLSASRAQFVRDISAQDYIHMAKLGIFVPEGFSGNLAEYAKVLEKCMDHATGVLGDVLTPFNSFLSGLISSDQTRLAQLDPNHKLRQRDRERDALTKEVGAFFNKHKTQTTTTLGEVLGRNKDWEPLLISMVLLREQANKVPTDVVKKTVQDTTDLLSAVQESAKAGDLDNVSGVALRSLAQNTMSVAKEVEFFSITLFRVQNLATAVDTSVTKLEGILKG